MKLDSGFDTSKRFEGHEALATSTAGAIANWIKVIAISEPEIGKDNWEKISKAIAVAKCIDPEHPDILVIEFQLNQGVALEKPLAADTAGAMGAQVLYDVINSVGLKESTDGKEKLLCGYLLEVAATMDPTNTDVVVAHMKNNGGRNDWSALLNLGNDTVGAGVSTTTAQVKPQEKVEAQGPQSSQSKITILLVSQMTSGSWFGTTNDLIATVNTNSSRDGIYANFQDKLLNSTQRPYSPSRYDRDNNDPRMNRDQESSLGATGKQMNIALDEAVRLVRSRHEGVNADIELSFEDKYTSKDGGSLGLAAGLLLSSVIEGFEMDPEFAVTGDISADGSVRLVGGIAAKLEGAQESGAKVIVMPHENLEAIYAMEVDNDLGLFSKVQVFSVETYDEALKIAKNEKAEEYHQATAKFVELQQTSNQERRLALMDEILELTPNHVSVQTLKRQLTGNLARRYSLKASVDKIFEAAAPFLSILLLEKNRTLNLSDRDKFTVPEMSSSDFTQSQNKLNEVSLKIHKSAEPLHSSVQYVIRAWKEYLKQGIRSRSSREDFLEARDEFHQELDALRMDDDMLKEMLR